MHSIFYFCLYFYAFILRVFCSFSATGILFLLYGYFVFIVRVLFISFLLYGYYVYEVFEVSDHETC